MNAWDVALGIAIGLGVSSSIFYRWHVKQLAGWKDALDGWRTANERNKTILREHGEHLTWIAMWFDQQSRDAKRPEKRS